MKKFGKWFIGSFLFLLVVTFIPAIMSPHGTLHYFEGFVFVLIGAFVLTCLFYYLEVKFIPKRKKRVMNKIIETYGSNRIDESTTLFKINTLSIYSKLNFSLQISEYHGYSETIQFHVPRKEIELLPLRSQFKLKESTCGGIETYLIYEGSSRHLKQAQRKLEKKASELLGLPIKSSFIGSGSGNASMPYN